MVECLFDSRGFGAKVMSLVQSATADSDNLPMMRYGRLCVLNSVLQTKSSLECNRNALRIKKLLVTNFWLMSYIT